jgi:hypothetical protein
MIDPHEYVAAETLKGGLAVTIRALRPDDRQRVAQAVRGLEQESIYFRLFSYRGELSEAGLDRIMKFDPEREVALIATTADEEEIVIGSGRYLLTGPGRAEVAFIVEEDYHGRESSRSCAISRSSRAITASRRSEPKCSRRIRRCARCSSGPDGRCSRGARAEPCTSRRAAGRPFVISGRAARLPRRLQRAPATRVLQSIP